MARTSKKNESPDRSGFGPKITPATGNPSPTAVSEPAAKAPGKVVPVGKAGSFSTPTHQQIEQRAREIWRKKGCPAGQDEKNWLEAEAQLKKELGIR